MGAEDLLDAVALEGGLAGEEAVEGAAQGVEIAAMIGCVAESLFGRHEMWRSRHIAQVIFVCQR